MAHRPFHSILALLAAGWISACAGTILPEAVEVVPDECLVASEGGAPLDTLVIALADSVHPRNAPAPTNASERLVFRQLYETLIRLDCNGRPRPGLASSWHADSTATVWTLTLGDHRFPSGWAVTAQDVILSWARGGLADRRPWLRQVEAPSDDRIVVTFTAPQRAGPAALADPVLAVADHGGDAEWPGTTGAFKPVPPTEAGTGLVAVPAGSTSHPVLVFGPAEGIDPRDLLARGADLLVSRDPATLAYAEGLPDFAVVPLPWDVTYGLVAPTVPALDTGADSASRARFRAALARDAVTGEARGAEPPFSWEAALTCRIGFPAGGRPSRRVVYPAGDRTAQLLAERIVALSGAARGGIISIRGLEPDALAAALRDGTDAAFVIPFPRLGPASCGDLPTLPAGAMVEPLVDTRARLIIRRGAARVTIDADATPRIVP